jgi:hypothetical protein
VRTAALVLAVLAASTASGCGGSSASQAPAPGPEPVATTEPTTAVASTPTQPTGCTATRIETLVERFVVAFNSGDLEQLDAIFAAREQFRWYTTDAPGKRLGGTRGDLMGYFERRHLKHEHLQLQAVNFNGNSDGFGHFAYRLVRRASDLEPTDYHGKGAAICGATDVIVVWSMARERAG